MAEKSGPPPVFTVQDAERQEPPPTYDSLFGKIKKAKKESNSKADLCKTVFAIISGSVLCIVFTGLMLAIPIAEIAIGAKYLHECPAERYIPIYLIVAGAFGLVAGCLSMGESVKDKQNEDDVEEQKKGNSCRQSLKSLVNTFLFAWFIAGNVWVYRLVGKWVSGPATAWNYCHSTVYYFAFWIITSTYIFIGVMCLVCIVLVVVACCCACAGDDDNNDN